jgi:hypothetical protein
MRQIVQRQRVDEKKGRPLEVLLDGAATTSCPASRPYFSAIKGGVRVGGGMNLVAEEEGTTTQRQSMRGCGGGVVDFTASRSILRCSGPRSADKDGEADCVGEVPGNRKALS